MKHQVVSVFDSASGLYGRPVFVHAVGQAVRSFSDEVNSGEGDIAKHSEDFVLFSLAEFDDEAGSFISSGPQVLMRGKDCKVSKEV